MAISFQFGVLKHKNANYLLIIRVDREVNGYQNMLFIKKIR